jgi:hypothetical protein
MQVTVVHFGLLFELLQRHTEINNFQHHLQRKKELISAVRAGKFTTAVKLLDEGIVAGTVALAR